jgi:hypothetical protein
MKIKLGTLVGFIGSSWFFAVTLFLFIFESSWLAITSRFPMAFDEQYHFGLIQVYSHHLNPIITHQVSSTYKYGALIQNTSFLYHYLLGYFYRVIILFTQSYETQVICLRLINVILAVASILVIRKLLRAINVSAGLTNVLVLAFAFTPIVPVLSAQINYDNLLNLLIWLCVYETVLFTKHLDQKIFDIQCLLLLTSLLLFSSLVKYSFLPIGLAIVLILIWKIRAYQRLLTRGLITELKKSFKRASVIPRTLLLGTCLIGGLLFARVYFVNIVRYHTPIPQCDRVLNISACEHYYAWESNYLLLQSKKTNLALPKKNIVEYTAYWLVISTEGDIGAIMPLQGLYYIPSVFATVFALLGAISLVCMLVNFKKLMRNNWGLRIFVLVSLLYLCALWARNYFDYLHLGKVVAIDGRYTIPVLIFIYTLLATGLKYTYNGHRWLDLKVALALVVIIAFVVGGGFVQYITHIDPVYGHLSSTNTFSLPEYY